MCYEVVVFCMYGISFVRILSNICREFSECCVLLIGIFLSVYLVSFRFRIFKNLFIFINKKMEIKILIYLKY